MRDDLAAIYCRLSKEDMDKDFDKTVSESIKNQKTMLETYATEKNWRIYDFYIDEDYSGSDRDRPEFNRLITDSLMGRFNIVLCKKQARFARDIEYIEKYVHGLFVERQIRFVAVLDNIDTGTVNRSARKASQINSLVDEWYLSDLSENIISSLTIKRQKAEFIGSWAPYGYRKDPKNKNSLLVDPGAAEIVKEIYELYLNGTGISRISQALNIKGIPNPLTYKQQSDEKINPNPLKKTIKRHLWTPSTISSILHNQTYMGSMVQGKYRKANYKSKKLLRVPKNDWIIVPNSHEPIIAPDIWKSVQKKLSSRNRVSANRQNHHVLAGKVYCGECGSKLVASGGRSGNKKTTYLCCSNHNLSKESCSGARIELLKLENVILNQVNALSSRYFDSEYIFSHLAFDSLLPKSRKNVSLSRLQVIQDCIKTINRKKEILYSDKLDNIINQNQYITFRNKLDQELREIQLEQFQIEEELSYMDEHPPELVNQSKLLDRYKISTVLTQEMTDQFIDSVLIFKRINGESSQQIVINWNF